MDAADIIEGRGCLRLRAPAGAAGDDDEIASGRIVDAVVGRNVQSVGERYRTRLRRNGANRNLWRNTPRHRQYAEGRQIDRFDAVVDEDAEPHGAISF
jgi:hypothetical protein